MNCPVCKSVQLVIADRQGVEIDFCPQCRGVWLDRGELDKILERSARHFGYDDDRPRGSYDRRPVEQHHHHYKKKKSWLHELFD